MTALLGKLFARHRRSLWWVVMRIVRDPQTADDLAQETYLRTLHALEARPIQHLESYLYQTARHLALDHTRKRKYRNRFEERDIAWADVETVASDGASAEEDLLERERQRLLEAALAELPDRARRAWALSQVDGWTYQQIADHLGVSRNTVYNDVKLVLGHCRDVMARLEQG
ncbi:RNA polymerase sigma factor, sigma-70 family [Rhizobium sp. RU35A]|nr:sigma-70 family RNA polymerase sigma factor [Rhizobium sp. RU35A]SIQ37518.1 RNA polymerase sigma factor, sigma-70 family [Rhizobium sp. RU35A]